MDHEDLVTTFGQSVGVEKARLLVEDALDDLGIEPREQYSSHEIADVCETIGRENEGYVRVVANEVRIQERAQRRFDALLGEISDPVVTVSFAGATPVVEAINPAFEETFGYGSEATGRPLVELIVPEDAEEDAGTVDWWFRSDRPTGTEIQRVTADSERRTFLFRSVVVTGIDGGIEGYGIYTDITERKRRERTLQHQNEQLERFASVVSHDLRNPLSVAQGNLELAQRAASDPDMESYLERIEESHDRMTDLIDHLLDLASQGRSVDDPCPVRVLDAVRTAWNTVDTEGARLVVTFQGGLVIEADEDRLVQLLENLFRNSVEHGSTSPDSQARRDAVEHGTRRCPDREAQGDENESRSTVGATRARDATTTWEDPDGTTLSSDGPKIEPSDGETLVLGPSNPDVTVRVAWNDGTLVVEDDGPGLPEADRDRIFEHGYTTTEDGTGFGLAIVQAIAEAHGWSIDVDDGHQGDGSQGARFELSGIAPVE